MSWKCVCKEENNNDKNNICRNCGRKKPEYLGIKLDINSTEKMNDEQKSIWYLMLAYDHLKDSNNNLSYYKELNDKVGNQDYDQYKLEQRIKRYNIIVEHDCQKCLSMLEISSMLNKNAQFVDNKEFIYNISSIKSDCYFNLGSLNFKKELYSEAIKYYQKSYDADPNQVSIYNIAMATNNMKVESGGIFGGKKKEIEEKLKSEQVVELLKKTISFAPFSPIGRKSGIMLINDYGITEVGI